MHSRPRAVRQRRLFAVALAVLLALFAAACGDDSDDDVAPSGTAGDEGTGTTEPASNEPVAGGEATILLYSEIGTLDPLQATGSGGSDGMRFFALYGALLVLDPDTGDTVPVLAESMTPSADFLTWTLKLKPGITFSDGSPFDAAAVKANWDRMSDTSKRSPSLTTLLNVESTTVTDPQTLTIQLRSPNAHFDNAIARVGTNYIASAQAIAEGRDLTSDAVGAGPFLLDTWQRDDRMVMSKNPDWKGSDGPYLDKLIFRVVSDEDQRIDTFITGQADAFYTATPASVKRATERVDGSEYVSVRVTTGQTIVFNNSKPPFDDQRVRKAFVQGIDWQALADTVFGEGSKAQTNFTLEGTKWYAPNATLPPYDPQEAQRLVDEYLEETGQSTLVIEYQAFQQSLDQARAEFIQTSLNQLDGVDVKVTVGDSPTNIQRVLNAEYMVSSWGFPSVDMDPGLYNAAHSESFNNYGKYVNADVDEKLNQARVTDDDDVRLKLYQEVYEQLAEDLPFYPYVETENGFVMAPHLKGGEVYYDGILRFDLIWRTK